MTQLPIHSRWGQVHDIRTPLASTSLPLTVRSPRRAVAKFAPICIMYVTLSAGRVRHSRRWSSFGPKFEHHQLESVSVSSMLTV